MRGENVSLVGTAHGAQADPCRHSRGAGGTPKPPRRRGFGGSKCKLNTASVAGV
jgi:hypothetical protein